MTEPCHHSKVVTMTGPNYGVGHGMYLYACADCRIRFYPACPVCVVNGHRNGVHERAEAAAPIDVERLHVAIRRIALREGHPGHGDLRSGLTTPGLGHGYEVTLAGAIAEEYDREA